MARSTDALERRARKRNRTMEEQQTLDAKRAKLVKKEKLVAQAPGAWKCPACQTLNFASRYICHAKNCQEPKPTEAAPKVVPEHHVDEDMKKLEWSKAQASPGQIEYNQNLRRRYAEKDPTLTQEELERAQILVGRDERKKSKRKDQRGETMQKEEPPPKETPMTSQEQRKRNKALLKKFHKWGGEGMKEDEVARAKLLIARKDRKQQQQQSTEKDDGEKRKQKSLVPIDRVKADPEEKSQEPVSEPTDSVVLCEKDTPTLDEVVVTAPNQSQDPKSLEDTKLPKAIQREKKTKKKSKKEAESNHVGASSNLDDKTPNNESDSPLGVSGEEDAKEHQKKPKRSKSASKEKKAKKKSDKRRKTL